MKLKIFLIVMALTALASGMVVAQDSPLLMLVNGANVWAATSNGIQQITTSNYNDRPMVSPDGRFFASEVIADVGIRALQTTGGMGIELPSDIEIYSTTGGGGRRIATQPPDATYNAGEPARVIVRSTPSWSPDGVALAWTEDVAPENVRRLVAYILSSDETRILASDLPLQAGFQQTLPARWGHGGIAVKSTTDSGGGALVETILIYGTDGAQRAATTLQPQAGEFVYEFGWINDGGTDFVGVVYSSGRWELINPNGGGLSALNGTPELFSVTAPNGMAVQFSITSSGGTPTFVWAVNGQQIPFNGPLEWITIAPSGNAIAYMVQGNAYVWQNGQASLISGTDAAGFSVAEVAWGGTAWRVRR